MLFLLDLGTGSKVPRRPPPPPAKHVPAVVQLYCNLCKITCAGQQCYDAHVIGQKHKKKKLQQDGLKELSKELESMGNKLAPSSSHNELNCPLCNVTCTGVDAYRSHINGKNHQKVARLHKELGKTVPDCNMPVKALAPTPSSVATTSAAKSMATLFSHEFSIYV